VNNRVTISCSDHPKRDRTIVAQLNRMAGDAWVEQPRRSSRQRRSLPPERLQWTLSDKESAGRVLGDSGPQRHAPPA
jgi:hypothetical protein